MDRYVIEDLGWATVEVNGVEQRKDVVRLHYQLQELYGRLVEAPELAIREAVADLVKAEGWPRPTSEGALRFMLAVRHAAEQVKKKPNHWQDLPASTASTPSP